ncbi:hypothetical protein [Leptospira santarosai]|uniref:hypothetical protein n=1 Tax=Leptospira santarosai TaxID=28183 RepID=UPI0002BF5DB3|nr:hypothetical protein [Leptospira santarosai]EMO32305.1 hypothetical protein LEP1GSC175_0611 [Leptospira santarosai str. HAI821]
MRRIGIIAQRIPVLSTSVFFPILSEQEIGSYSELYNRVSKILLPNGDWTQNEWYPIP